MMLCFNSKIKYFQISFANNDDVTNIPHKSQSSVSIDMKLFLV